MQLSHVELSQVQVVGALFEVLLPLELVLLALLGLTVFVLLLVSPPVLLPPPHPPSRSASTSGTNVTDLLRISFSSSQLFTAHSYYFRYL